MSWEKIYEISYLVLRSKQKALIKKIFKKNRTILEILQWVSYLCSDEPIFASSGPILAVKVSATA